ncbi:hypothetical protein [Pseudonocardia abyssalis]|uniref:Uncharacterized protein n=1 Tax=Pseudonocardia abyssalis TaxID=2792008 RepID=A0ABS6UM35_9PSEU|nr:hypothetical protein [Pseudonocardia abyssalis]MBW0116411.1 hypothetical protein [Pseudonocardia abyssalis]MBW0133311.1 hypothetical protein [Pseudonocardia abyssalis]
MAHLTNSGLGGRPVAVNALNMSHAPTTPQQRDDRMLPTQRREAHPVTTAEDQRPEHGRVGVRERRRRLTVAGVAGGVGATTIATALGAADRGIFVGRAVDVLVCRATGDSLIRAGRAAQLVAQVTGQRPVLAVTAADARGPSRPVTTRLRLLEPHACAVVVLPYVRRWAELAAPLDEVRGLLAAHPAELPRRLRRYADALRDLRAAMDGRSPATARPVPGRAPRTTTTASTIGRTP